jgi:hypothetical protein
MCQDEFFHSISAVRLILFSVHHMFRLKVLTVRCLHHCPLLHSVWGLHVVPSCSNREVLFMNTSITGTLALCLCISHLSVVAVGHSFYEHVTESCSLSTLSFQCPSSFHALLPFTPWRTPEISCYALCLIYYIPTSLNHGLRFRPMLYFPVTRYISMSCG